MLTGEIRKHAAFPSRHIDPHDLIVHLPPGYHETDRSYPVLYLQDGQNLFDPATAFGGQDWHVDRTADALIENGSIEPLIIVGIYNAGEKRIEEYTRHRRHYGRMLVEELKPFIDSEYRTASDWVNTGLGGSSLGGLVSLALGLHYSEVFGKLAILSPSVWWDNRAILRFLHAADVVKRPRIWLDIGTEEGSSPERTTHDVRLLRDALVAKGWTQGDDLTYFEAEGAGHNEGAWAARVEPMLRYLFGVR